MAELSDQEMLRYNRQIILRGFDFDGQEALKDSRVLVVGLGKAEKFTVEGIRQAAATAARKARDLGVTQLHTVAVAGNASPLASTLVKLKPA